MIESCFLSVKPDTVNETIKVIEHGPTWLQFEVDFPQGIDTEVCNELSNNTKGHLKIKCSVRLLSEFEQSQKLKENIEFQVKYGFWRNIQSDNETAAKLSLGFPSYQVIYTTTSCIKVVLESAKVVFR